MKEIGTINVVLVITQDDCKYCKALKNYFTLNNIAFAEQDFNDLPKLFSRELVRCRKKNKVKKIGLPLWIYNGILYEGYDEGFLKETFGV